MKQYILFDLDGTLTDPKLGITSCVQYALRAYGVEEPDLDKLEPFIGPPLKDSFMSFYGFDEAKATEAVAKYRERFSDVGLFENEIYPGIPGMLKKLKAGGLQLAVASSKPTVYVERILEHFHIKEYFKVIVGSELDGRRSAKEEVVEEALRQLFAGKTVERERVYMVGDRKFDVEGARALGVESVGVTYGYGGMEELKEAHADYIVRSVEELEELLLREVEEPRPNGFFQVMWPFLYPVLLFMCVRQLVSQVLLLALSAAAPNLTGRIAEWIVLRDEATGEIVALTGNISTIMNEICFLAAALCIWNMALPMIRKAKEDMWLAHLKSEPPKAYAALTVASIGAVVGLNVLTELTGITNYSESYQIVRGNQYSASLLVGLICYGMITPVCEELLFRGILYNLLKKRMKLQAAMLFSALFFGIYHMNYVQGVYAFVIGCLMVYAYEYFGSFAMPVLVHVLANCLAYVVGHSGLVDTALVSWPVCVLSLGAAAAAIILLSRWKRYRKGTDIR